MPAMARSSRIIANDAPFSRSSATPSRSGSSAANRFGGTPAKPRTASAKRSCRASAAAAPLTMHLLLPRSVDLSKRTFGVGRPIYQGSRFLPWAKAIHTASRRCVQGSRMNVMRLQSQHLKTLPASHWRMFPWLVSIILHWGTAGLSWSSVALHHPIGDHAPGGSAPTPPTKVTDCPAGAWRGRLSA